MAKVILRPIGTTLLAAGLLLAGIYATGQKPTGTRDPFGLRRAALGLLRIIGKGNKERLVPVGRDALKYLKIYLEEIRINCLATNGTARLVITNGGSLVMTESSGVNLWVGFAFPIHTTNTFGIARL